MNQINSAMPPDAVQQNSNSTYILLHPTRTTPNHSSSQENTNWHMSN